MTRTSRQESRARAHAPPRARTQCTPRPNTRAPPNPSAKFTPRTVSLLAQLQHPSVRLAQGAALPPITKMAGAKINVIAADAVAAGEGQFGMLFWVAPRDYRSAAKLLEVP